MWGDKQSARLPFPLETRDESLTAFYLHTRTKKWERGEEIRIKMAWCMVDGE